jgi:hypothetical protein
VLRPLDSAVGHGAANVAALRRLRNMVRLRICAQFCKWNSHPTPDPVRLEGLLINPERDPSLNPG